MYLRPSILTVLWPLRRVSPYISQLEATPPLTGLSQSATHSKCTFETDLEMHCRNKRSQSEATWSRWKLQQAVNPPLWYQPIHLQIQLQLQLQQAVNLPLWGRAIHLCCCCQSHTLNRIQLEDIFEEERLDLREFISLSRTSSNQCLISNKDDLLHRGFRLFCSLYCCRLLNLLTFDCLIEYCISYFYWIFSFGSDSIWTDHSLQFNLNWPRLTRWHEVKFGRHTCTQCGKLQVSSIAHCSPWTMFSEHAVVYFLWCWKWLWCWKNLFTSLLFNCWRISFWVDWASNVHFSTVQFNWNFSKLHQMSLR